MNCPKRIKIFRDLLQLSLELLADSSSKSTPTGSVISLCRILSYIAMEWRDDAELIVSKAHACAGEYAFHVLVSKRLDEATARTYGKEGGIETHSSHLVNGVPFTLGSLGMGYALACGMALAGKTVFVVVGDGEARSGATMEARRVAAKSCIHGAPYIYVDYNGAGACEKLIGDYRNRKLDKHIGLHCPELEAHYKRITSEDIPAIIEEVLYVETH